MFRNRLFPSLLLLMGAAGMGEAQTLFVDPPRFHLNNRPYSGPEIHTISLMVDFGIQNAVAWGATITLGNTDYIEFVPNFDGAGRPFLSTQPYFNRDFSDYSDVSIGDGDAILKLNFINFTDPDSVFGEFGPVMLGQFQVRIKGEPGYPDFEQANDPIAPFWHNTSITLSPLGIPPDGSAVQDNDGNNLLRTVTSGYVTTHPSTPEPAAWVTMVGGMGMAVLLMRRKRAGYCRVLKTPGRKKQASFRRTNFE